MTFVFSTTAINSAEEVVRVPMSVLWANKLLWAAYNQRWTDRKLALDQALLQIASMVRLGDPRTRQ